MSEERRGMVKTLYGGSYRLTETKQLAVKPILGDETAPWRSGFPEKRNEKYYYFHNYVVRHKVLYEQTTR
jgi:hypothetical protein